MAVGKTENSVIIIKMAQIALGKAEETGHKVKNGTNGSRKTV
jgi:hypothetical protein